MRKRPLISAGLLTASLIASPAFAQGGAAERGTAPRAGSTSFGVAIGSAIPSDDTLDTGLDIRVTGEYFLTPRTSLRGALSGAFWDVSGHAFTGTVKPLAVDGNVVYNWSRGVWRPYLTAGLGVYRYRFEELNFNDSETKFGANIGGGLEYRAERRRGPDRRSAAARGERHDHQHADALRSDVLGLLRRLQEILRRPVISAIRSEPLDQIGEIIRSGGKRATALSFAGICLTELTTYDSNGQYMPLTTNVE